MSWLRLFSQETVFPKLILLELNDTDKHVTSKYGHYTLPFHILLLFKSTKHEKLENYWWYCTQDSSVTNADSKYNI